MKLGIVGHAEDKFTKETKLQAVTAITQAIQQYQADTVVSGHCPLGGIDIWAEEVAELLHLNTIIHEPGIHQWSGVGGFQDRNLKIARDSDLVLCVVVKELPPSYKGRVFKYCYHCKDRNPPHIKSGGCWTAWKCRKQAWIFI